MATSLLDRLGLGNARAVANAHQEALRPRRDDRIIADLVDALACNEAARAPRALRGTDAAPGLDRASAA